MIDRETGGEGNDDRDYGKRSGDRNQTRGIGMAVTRRCVAACMLLAILSLLVETGEVNATMRFGWGLVSRKLFSSATTKNEKLWKSRKYLHSSSGRKSSDRFEQSYS